ncbi:MAG TPA: gamma carbonic anhydrase family protein [Clostridia bacterium]|nr:gamma carbonic anhydrase family protein [Clostridia bacterium]
MNKKAKIHPSVYVHSSAVIMGDVTLDQGANIWPGVVLRGDYNHIKIGENTNIQDLACLHINTNLPCLVGKNVTVGHGAIVHACTVEDNVLIGMGAILLDDCHIGKGSWIGAGSLVTEGTIIPPGVLALGTPAKVIRELTSQEKEEHLVQNAAYVKRAGVLKEKE